VDVNASNQGQGTAASGNAAATGMAGSTSFNATISTAASTGQASTLPPGTATTSATQTQGGGSTPTSAVAASVSVAATTSATAASGGATAVGVNAQTVISGDQAVVVHIPANTSGQTINVTLNATVQNTGTATSQSGNVQAQALLNGAAGAATTSNQPAGGNTTSNSTSQAAGAAGAKTATNTVDVRDVNYALAQSGDALAIGVKADTVINGVQQVLVIIDDNSSGNRIIITFQVVVQNTGSATAISGSTSALGSNGSLPLPADPTAGSLTVDNGATALSGSATAIGVQANTLIGVNQSVILQAGQNSNNNEVDVNFGAAVSNTGTAAAQSGDAQAMAQAGDAGGQPSVPTSGNNNSLSTSAIAIGSSGATDATGVVASTTIDEQQPATVTVDNNNPLPIAISQNDRVINLGIGRSQSGDVAVIAQVDPPPPTVNPPATPVTPVTPASPTPPATVDPGPASTSGSTILRVADPNFTVSPASAPASAPEPAAGSAAPPAPVINALANESAIAGATTPPVTVRTADPSQSHAPSQPAGASESIPVVAPSDAGSADAPGLGVSPAGAYSMILVSAGALAQPTSTVPTVATTQSTGEKPTLPPFLAWSVVGLLPGILALVRGRWSPLP